MTQYRDKIFLRCETHLNLWDRLLVLLGRPLLTRAEIDCENEPGQTRSSAVVYPARIVWPWITRGGFEPSGKHIDGLSDFANLNGAGRDD